MGKDVYGRWGRVRMSMGDWGRVRMSMGDGGG